MNVREAKKEDSRIVFELLKTNNSIIPLSESLLKSILGSKQVYCEVFEVDDKIVSAFLGFDKKIIETTKEFKSIPIFKQLLDEVFYDFTYFHSLSAKEGPQSKNYKKMMMMSYLDAVKKKTVITLVKEPIEEFIAHQLKYYRFQEEKKINVKGEELIMFELDN